MTEDEFQEAVIDLAARLGWRAMHVRRSTVGTKSGRNKWLTATSISGWPDLTLWHPDGGLVFAELKAQKGRPTPAQTEVLGQLGKSAPSFIWRPSDLKTIAKTLVTLRGKGGAR